VNDNGQRPEIVRKMPHTHVTNNIDSRVKNTRMVLFQAFSSLVLNRAYDDIRVTDIIEKAGISRSTFYQHYKNKDDILADSMSGIFGVLADAACGQGQASHLHSVLEHFWQNRNFGRIILNGPAYKRMASELALIIESRLDTTPEPHTPPALQLKAIQLAEGQFAPIRAWLSGNISCHTEEMATQLMN